MLQKKLEQLGFGPNATKGLAWFVISALITAVGALWNNNNSLHNRIDQIQVERLVEMQKAKQEAYNEMKSFFTSQAEALEKARTEQEEMKNAIDALKAQAKRFKR